ncbi:MAG: OmpA family protein [Bacteroidales bacterium]|nr:OmpA family protein [Bacteroidales bacterium]MBD5333624.1 OmpA family protein [Bacteroides sp.]
MKKSLIFGFLAAMFIGQSAMAQSQQEIIYVEDPSQGYVLNGFSNNWFISAEGGFNYYFKNDNSERKFADRFSPNAGLWVGKWFSPIVGLRAGFNWTQVKGLGKGEGVGYYGEFENYDKFKMNEFSAQFNAMVNLTNWWCGYRPGRVYNGIIYGGFGLNFPYAPKWVEGGRRDGWSRVRNGMISASAGLINSFNVSKNVALYLDLRVQNMTTEMQYATADKNKFDLQAYLGLTYNFNKSTWSAPIVPIIPEIPNCDEVEARLQAAQGRIADLERQLRDCLNRPVPTAAPAVEEGPLCTIYYTIGSSRLSRVDSKVLNAVANVMKANTNTKYTVTGYADNYTGSAAVNDRLRQARAKGVEKALLRNGVSASQLDVTTNNSNLYGEGKEYVSLDRAVTIKANK